MKIFILLGVLNVMVLFILIYDMNNDFKSVHYEICKTSNIRYAKRHLFDIGITFNVNRIEDDIQFIVGNIIVTQLLDNIYSFGVE